MAALDEGIKKLLKKYMQKKWHKYSSEDISAWTDRVDKWLRRKKGYTKRRYAYDELRDNIKHERARLLED